MDELGDKSRPITPRCAWDGWVVASDCVARVVSLLAPPPSADEGSPDQ